MRQKIQQIRNKKRTTKAALFIVGFAIVGISFLTLTRANTIVANLETESGTRAGSAARINDTSASNGQAIKFGVSSASTFITRQGMKLYLNGSEYKFNGANYASMVAGNCGVTASNAQMDAYFDSLPPRSMTRIWAINNSTSLTALDNVVAKAQAKNQYLTITLSDQGGGCDNMVRGDASFYSGGYKNAYFTWVRNVVGRYKDSKTVGLWEIINEGHGNAITFVNDSAALIKSIDPNHLVSTGAAGFDSSANYVNIHASPNIDLVSAHEYDNGPGDSPWATRCRNVAVQLNKPCYIGEYGYLASPSGNSGITYGAQRCENFSTRASWVKTKTTSYLSHGDVAGALIWNQDARNLTDCQISFSAGDPLVAAIRSVTNYPNGGGGGGDPTPDPEPPVTSGTVNDTSFTYSGTWQTSTNAGEYQGNDHYSATAGSAATITFTGTQIKLYTSKAAHHGIATVSIDGGPATNIDQYAATRQDQVNVYTSPALSSGTHTLTFTVSGTKNAASSGTVVNIDRADITP